MNAEGPAGPEVSEPDMQERTCPICKDAFDCPSAKRIYCSPRCASEFVRLLRAEQAARRVAARPAKSCARPECDEQVPAGAHHNRRYCSDRCSGEAIYHATGTYRKRWGLERQGPKRGTIQIQVCEGPDCRVEFESQDRRHRFCRPCAAARNRTRASATKKATQAQRNAHRTCKLCTEVIPIVVHGKRIYCDTCTENENARKDASLRSAYNIDLLQYRAMASHGCSICGLMRSNDRQLAVDHDHACCAGKRSCGKCVRGLLCLSCNTTLGINNDDPARLRAAADYLERNSHGY